MPCLEETSVPGGVSSPISLSPAQLRALEEVRRSMCACPVVLLRSEPGMGRTSILRALATSTDAAFLNGRDLLDALKVRSPAEIEEALLAAIEHAFGGADVLIWDDLHLVTHFTNNYYYQRRHFLSIVLSAILERWRGEKRFVLGTLEGNVPWILRHSSLSVEVPDFTSADYAAICRLSLDYKKIFRHAPGLNAWQLINARRWFAAGAEATTDSFIEYLDAQDLTSNVDLEEVAPVRWSDLKGMDDIIAQLEAKVALSL